MHSPLGRVLVALLVAACLGTFLGGCPSMGAHPPGQPVTAAQHRADYTAAVGEATELVDQVTRAATAAIQADVLKGGDADNAVAGIKVARDGLALARALVSTGQLTPEQGSQRVAITIALLTASQAYLNTLGAKKP